MIKKTRVVIYMVMFTNFTRAQKIAVNIPTLISITMHYFEGKNILVSALPYLHYARGHSHIAFNRDFSPLLNKMTYSIANFGMIITTLITKKWLNITRKITARQIIIAFESNQTIYTISPTLFPRPDYWEENLKVFGYQERNKTINWEPDEVL